MIKVLVVDDSPLIQKLMINILNSDNDIQVMGVVNSGEKAVKFVEKNKPDIITMDINMPGMDGFEATRRIMETNPTPIVVITALFNSKDVDRTFQAMEAGALSVIEKPVVATEEEFHKTSQEIINMIKIMSEVKVIRRKARYMNIKNEPLNKVKTNLTNIKVAAIGVSTGGPPVLQTIFSKLPEHIEIPILVVQHIAPGFINGLVGWLAQTTGHSIHIAFQGEKALPGHIYFAPDGYHMGIRSNGQIFLSNTEKENSLKPAVSYLFRSIADSYGEKSINILLTGMGKDGARELKLLRDKGAMTVAQDKETSVVYGMPGEAVNINAATYVLSPEKIAELFFEL